MLNLPSSVRIYLFTAPTDMRRGVDGLASLVVASGLDIYSGHLFVFVSRRADRAKILTWSRGGFVLWYKRLERGRFRRPIVAAGQARTTIEPDQLILLLEGVDLRTVRRAPRWHPNKGIDSAPTS